MPQTTEVALTFNSKYRSKHCRENVLNSEFGSLTYSEKNHHAEHRQQGGDNHAEEGRQLLGLPLLAGALADVPRVLLGAMAAAG